MEKFFHYTPNIHGKTSLAWLRIKLTIGSSRKVDLAIIGSAVSTATHRNEDIGHLQRPTQAHRRPHGTNTTINSTSVAR